MFGDYDIIETVGQGGMGIVYRAIDTNLGRTVALKVLKEDLRSHQQIVARFQREAEAFATLNHPNIVHIYSVGSVGRIPFIAMELIEGETISLRMRREKRIPWKDALEIGAQIASALSCAHESGIIHRDIKPGNIIIDRKNHAYVTDFGIAKVLTAETQLTVEGSRLGTPQYMSPERCQNKPVVPQSDLYSLGVLLFQMITGKLPYEAADTIELLRKIVSEPPMRLRELEPEAPKDAERLIAYLLEKRPEDRPATGDDWARLCQRVLDGLPLDEHDTGAVSSLQGMRDGMVTPTPGMLGTDSTLTTGIGGNSSVGAALRRYRFPLMISLLIASALAAGFWVARPSAEFVPIAELEGLRSSAAGWAIADRPATWQSITGGSRLHFGIPGTRLSGVDWDGPSLFVKVTGIDEEGSKGIAVARVDTRSVEWAFPPGTIAAGATYVTAWQGGVILADFANPAGRFQYHLPGAGAQWRPGEPPLPFRGQEAGSGVCYDRGGTNWLVLARQVGDAWQVTLHNPFGKRRLDMPDGIGNLAWIAMHREDHAVYALGEQSKGGTLLVRWGADESEPEVLLEGRLAAQRGALHSQDAAVLLIERRSDEEGMVFVFDAATRRRRNTLGSAQAAVWHPAENVVLMAANDSDGLVQLWAASPDAPGLRLQLTFESEGIDPALRVGPEAKYCAVIGGPNRSDVLLIDISRAALIDQGMPLE